MGRTASKPRLELLERRDVPGETLQSVLSVVLVGDGWFVPESSSRSDTGFFVDTSGNPLCSSFRPGVELGSFA